MAGSKWNGATIVEVLKRISATEQAAKLGNPQEATVIEQFCASLRKNMSDMVLEQSRPRGGLVIMKTDFRRR